MRHRIAKLAKKRLYEDAVILYAKHHSASIPPTNFTFPYILKACAELKAVSSGQMLHAHILKLGYTSEHTTTDLTNMYMKLGLVGGASKLFDEFPQPSLSVLNVIISGFVQNGLFEVAFGIFRMFCVFYLRIDSVTVAAVASSCRHAVNGMQLHCLAVKIGVDMDDYVATSLMTMYFNCMELHPASKLFGEIENKKLVCYNAYLSGLAQNGVVETVLRVFKEMRELLHENPTVVMMIATLSACGNGKCMRFGRQLHGLLMKTELEHDTNVSTSLVDMYSKCGSWKCSYSVFREMETNKNLTTWNSMIAGLMLNDQMESAIHLFNQLESEEGLEPDYVTWNSMISGFSHLGKADEAVLFFRKMLACGVMPNERCITSMLAVCSSCTMQSYGDQIHAYAARREITDDVFLATGIMDMYMKCGRPSLARNIFNQIRVKPNDPAFWNAMICGYGKNGMSQDAFDTYNEMTERKVKPNSVTFSCLLSVCSQTGSLDKAFEIFRLMTIEFNLEPTPKHTSILIDLLSRLGRLDEAFELLEATNEASAAVFASLLDASKNYSASGLGVEKMVQRILELEPGNPIPIVILSNIYAGQEKWKDVHKIRKLLDRKGLRKLPGISSVEVA